MDRITEKTRKRHPKALFWIMTPLLVPLFALILGLPAALLVWVLTMPFGPFAESTVNSIITITALICLGLGTLMVLYIWMLLKKNYFDG
jgi:hypothetical protein